MERNSSSSGCSTSYSYSVVTLPDQRGSANRPAHSGCYDLLCFELHPVDATPQLLHSRHRKCYRRHCLRGGSNVIQPSALAPADAPAPSLAYLLSHRPLAALTLVPKAGVLFLAGAVSGGLGALCRHLDHDSCCSRVAAIRDQATADAAPSQSLLVLTDMAPCFRQTPVDVQAKP